LRRLLLLPLLAPLLAVCLTGALNPRPAVSLRLLLWQSPALPLGAWLAAAAAAGAALSGGASALALREGSAPLRRQVRRGPGSSAYGAEGEPEERRWRSSSGVGGMGFRGGGWTPWSTEPFARRGDGPDEHRGERWRDPARPPWSGAAAAGPERAPGEPPPTVAVPYRVIRPRTDGASSAGAVRGAASGGLHGPAAEPRAPGREPEAVPVADGWGEADLEEW
jgi:hypothetical protein